MKKLSNTDAELQKRVAYTKKLVVSQIIIIRYARNRRVFRNLPNIDDEAFLQK